ncbi:MAG TPA: aspartate carbamoyltransferase [Burkholderiaceae bacterium]|nr:aspartate carbamoyltransferase [Burkholderiaceae bacterium]
MNTYWLTSQRCMQSIVFLLVFCTMSAFSQTRQEHVHEMGHNVMPFDLAKTRHIFQMTESGGVQRVIVNDVHDKDQIALVQKHLLHEATVFQRGDYSDPASLHGTDMPGLGELQRNASQIHVSYSALPNGAEILFETMDPHLITAIHRWFGAQLSEHGADAQPG